MESMEDMERGRERMWRESFRAFMLSVSSIVKMKSREDTMESM